MSDVMQTQRSVAEIATPLAAKYLTQLCKHFQHKIPVTVEGPTGHIVFTIGDCHLTADDHTLTLSLTSPDGAALDQLRDVVGRHLERFAFRDPLTIAWRMV